MALSALTACLFVVVGVGGCGLRAKIRASEQRSAERNVRLWHEHRKWEQCIASADRALAVQEVAPDSAVEVTLLKARCLFELKRKEESFAHYRLLRDYLFPRSDLPAHLPPKLEARLAAEPSLEATQASPHNQALLTVESPKARFTKAAKWSGVTGSVLVQWEIPSVGESRGIRVLNDVHPLLAGLAIEAAAASTVDRSRINVALLPLTKRVMFRFGD